MERDLRATPLYAEIEAFTRSVLGPGFGRPGDPAEPVPSPDGAQVAITCEVLEGLEGKPRGRIVLAATDGSGWRQVTSGPNDDRGPRWSPDGARLTFLSDRRSKGKHQLFSLAAGAIGEAAQLTDLPGTVEYHRWSGDGSRILLGVAGEAAEQADAMGSGRVGEADRGDDPDWLPEVRSWEIAEEERRRLFVLDVAGGAAEPLGPDDLTVWEATWAGDEVVALVSEGADEGAWYGARVVAIAVDGAVRALLSSDVQLNLLTECPDGSSIALVEARCSDRYVAAGELVVLDPAAGGIARVDTGDADVTHLAFAPDGRLLASALRGLDSVAFAVDVKTSSAEEVWSCEDATGSWYPAAAPLPGAGFVTVRSSALRPPAVIRVDRDGAETTIASFEHDGHDVARAHLDRVERVTWTAPDGWDIQGLVHLPVGAAPFPLLVFVHGGPVAAYQDEWIGVGDALLLSRGYALFAPNPRGSSGRGRPFAEAVVGDMGGADAADVLAGIDHLVAAGLADPARIGVVGGSYGGFMAAWLPAIDQRFAVSVAISPVTDWTSQHFTSSLAAWDQEFVGADPFDPAAYGARSPVLRAHSVRTPTLLTAGLGDRATPAGQAIEFAQALRLRGIPSEVVIYPEEGHGVGTYPAIVDVRTRMLAWIERFMPAR